MSPALNDIERRILDYMVSYLRSNTYQPSIREIGERFGIKSTKTVSEHLQALAEKGFLERDPSRSRGVRILGVDLAPDAVSVPLYDRLPDDRVNPGVAAADASMTLDRRLAGSKGSFLVMAAGTDLAVLGAVDGDYVLVEPARLEEVADGDVIAARIGGGAAGFHKLSRNGRGVYLEAVTSGGQPVLVEDPSRLDVMGRVGGIFHRTGSGAAAPNLTAH
jgi:repressor LexA